MDKKQKRSVAAENVRISPWIFSGAILIGLFTSLYGLAPGSYLLAMTGLGVIWLALLVTAWRKRNESLKFLSLLFASFSQQLLWHRFGSGHSFEIIQGGCVMFAVFSGLMFLLRRWLFTY